MSQPGGGQGSRNTFKQGKQIFLWANVDKDLEKARVKYKQMLKFIKVLFNKSAKTKV